MSSGGGHWLQLCRLIPAFQAHDVAFATVHAGYATQVPGCRFHVIPDATRWNKLKLVWLALRLLFLLLSERPEFVVTTGAAPGYLALRLGKVLGARTIWVDSVANIERLSMSGQLAGRHADLWLTQWPHLARPEGPQFMGGTI